MLVQDFLENSDRLPIRLLWCDNQLNYALIDSMANRGECFDRSWCEA
jgi:hypothetical protein